MDEATTPTAGALPEATPAPSRGAELRKLALGSRASKWKHELVRWNGQTFCVRAPSGMRACSWRQAGRAMTSSRRP